MNTSRSYACIISPDKAALLAVARRFAHSIEVIDDGVLFDVSGLDRLMGKSDRVADKILAEMRKESVGGSVAVAGTVETAMLLARCRGPRVSKGSDTLNVSPSLTVGPVQPEKFQQLPLTDLAIEQDTLNVFGDLGMRTVEDLLAVPHDELVGRYGREFQRVIDTIEQKAVTFLTPNVKDGNVSWNFDLDREVENFEQLIFVLNHGLERLLVDVEHRGLSCEHLDLLFKLRNKTEKSYEIKTSFPTLERTFWLKLINLRAALDPPEAEIVSVNVTAHFTKPRPAQRGLYAVSRPEPESLLLTVNKLKKLVGEENVGVPILLDQRLAEPFGLNANAMPDVVANSCDKHGREKRPSRSICGEARFAGEGPNSFAAVPPSNDSGGTAAGNIVPPSEKHSFSANRAAEPQEPALRAAIIAFNYFRPPIRAEVLVRDGRLVFVKSSQVAGHIVNYSGVWKGNSKWWDRPWRTQEWDIEVENDGVYRLCKARDEWFLIGEYD